MVNRRSGESSLYIQLFNQLKEELKQKRIGEKIDSELDLMDKCWRRAETTTNSRMKTTNTRQ